MSWRDIPDTELAEDKFLAASTLRDLRDNIAFVHGKTPTTVYTAGSGSYTVPEGVTALYVTLLGGGGGGGIGDAGGRGAGGGSTGEEVIAILPVTPGQVIAYAVGAGGGSGQNGGNTTFGGLTARGGNRGRHSSEGGGGGLELRLGSGPNVPRSAAGDAGRSDNAGGAGGTHRFGGTGGGTTGFEKPGQHASGYGNGGGGGGGTLGANMPGGSGTGGLIIIQPIG